MNAKRHNREGIRVIASPECCFDLVLRHIIVDSANGTHNLPCVLLRWTLLRAWTLSSPIASVGITALIGVCFLCRAAKSNERRSLGQVRTFCARAQERPNYKGKFQDW